MKYIEIDRSANCLYERKLGSKQKNILLEGFLQKNILNGVFKGLHSGLYFLTDAEYHSLSKLINHVKNTATPLQTGRMAESEAVQMPGSSQRLA